MSPVGERPSGTVTFLFTGIEGSTRLWEERPAEMRVALAAHDAFANGRRARRVRVLAWGEEALTLLGDEDGDLPAGVSYGLAECWRRRGREDDAYTIACRGLDAARRRRDAFGEVVALQSLWSVSQHRPRTEMVKVARQAWDAALALGDPM